MSEVIRKPMCVVVDGVDGIGKSTIAKMIADRHNFKYCPQPSPDNLVYYVRDIVKHTDAAPAIKQSLHVLSHIVDAHYQIDGSNLIFDRGILSTYVYSKALRLDHNIVSNLLEINSRIYNHFLEELYDYDVVFLLFDRNLSFKAEKDDRYEQLLDYRELRKLYYEALASKNFYHTKEVRHLVMVDAGIEDMYTKCCNLLNLEAISADSI